MYNELHLLGLAAERVRHGNSLCRCSLITEAYTEVDMKELPPQKYLQECFDYSPDTGELTWKERPINHFKNAHACHAWNARFPMTRVGWRAINKNKASYYHLSLDSVNYLAHRIIWALFYGESPNIIDHINGDSLDNRITNLRSVSQSENAKNQKRCIKNTSGVVGVHWSTRDLVWASSIRVNKYLIHLGNFRNFNDAVIARKMAEYENGFHENHGRSHE